MVKNILINELIENEKFQGFFMLKSIQTKKAKNNSLYIDIMLQDSSGNDVGGKIWRADKIDISGFKPGQIIKVAGLTQLYNNKKQLNIDKIRLSQSSDGVNALDFVESAPIESMEMIHKIDEYVEKIQNQDIKRLTAYLFSEKKEKLIYYPAAKTHHHNIRGGLLYHILTMLEVGEKISDSYPFINNDILFSGVILHDLAKVNEIDANEMGIVEDYSMEGKLLGHIIQGINDIDRAALELKIDDEAKVLIQHMILSHHYYPEFGSPKKPLIPEGELLHYLDVMDARMYAMEKALTNVKEGDFAEKNFTLEGRSMYKSKLGFEQMETEGI